MPDMSSALVESVERIREAARSVGTQQFSEAFLSQLEQSRKTLLEGFGGNKLQEVFANMLAPPEPPQWHIDPIYLATLPTIHSRFSAQDDEPEPPAKPKIGFVDTDKLGRVKKVK